MVSCGVLILEKKTMLSKYYDLIRQQMYLHLKRQKSSSQAQSSSVPSVSTACLSQSMEGQGPWIVDSGASNHNSCNNSDEEYQEYLRLKSSSQAQSSLQYQVFQQHAFLNLWKFKVHG